MDEQAIAKAVDKGHGQADRQVHQALLGAEAAVQRIVDAAGISAELCRGIQDQVTRMGHEVSQTREALTTATRRSESVLGVSERLMELIATSGVKTADTPYIELAQRVAAEIAEALDISVATVKREWNLARAWLLRELSCQ